MEERDPEFWSAAGRAAAAIDSFEQAMACATLLKRAAKRGISGEPQRKTVRLAIVGAYSFYPLHELIRFFAAAQPESPLECEFFLGDFDNYSYEMLDPASPLHQYRPDVLLVLPSARRCRYEGPLFDPPAKQAEHAEAAAAQILDLCRQAYEHSKMEICLANFPLPAHCDPGPFRTRTAGSDWTYRKIVNLRLGLDLPPHMHLCDLEFLSARRGTRTSVDERAWFESKQIGSPDFLVDVAREVVHLLRSFTTGPKKVAVLDLDNTLWGGVIGDDGVNGIELGDTNARGEAFKSFQTYLKSLTGRGILLAVCSKNDHEKAVEPFESHPDMVLRLEDFAAFKANWEPKSENIRQIAAELNLGTDALVFIDDNPAEIEIVRQFLPEVTGICLPDDPSQYVAEVANARVFEPRHLTAEDAERAAQYRQENKRKELESRSTDMGAYLRSLEMRAAIAGFRGVDAPRIAQLIARSNQFNVTTIRRSEAEVLEIVRDPAMPAFTIRLADRFGDYGLIAVVIGRVLPEGGVLEVDTWLMSCRVLKRQVEEETVNELVRLARQRGCTTIRGVYLPTKKNGLVRDLYPRMGFATVLDTPERQEYELDVTRWQDRETNITIEKRDYAAD